MEMSRLPPLLLLVILLAVALVGLRTSNAAAAKLNGSTSPRRPTDRPTGMRFLLLAAALAAAAPAHAFTSSNRMRVDATGPVTFSVSARGGQTGAIDFWCAAGEYAWRRLNAPHNARIYRLSEPPRRGGQPILFSLDPTGRASSTGLAVLGGDDGSLSVSSARNQCEAARLLNRRF